MAGNPWDNMVAQTLKRIVYLNSLLAKNPGKRQITDEITHRKLELIRYKEGQRSWNNKH